MQNINAKYKYKYKLYKYIMQVITMEDLVEILKEKALEYKNELKKEGVTLNIGDDEQKFRLSGIGAKAVKIEKFIKYEDIIAVTEEGNDNGLESILRKLIEDYEPSEDEDESID
jgi:hypothetical protein